MTSSGDDLYFSRQVAENDVFFGRFGAEPDWGAKCVLDFGCGHGAMAARAAAGGAARVVGLDISPELIAYAQSLDLPCCEFVCARAAALTEAFDLIVSKDTFEHVDDVAGTLRHLRRLLRPGGEIWVGFSPLYFSPWGDHARTGLRLPWLHVLPWPIVRGAATWLTGKKIAQPADIGLNRMTPREFRRHVADAGLAFRILLFNRGNKRLLRIMSVLRQIPQLEKFATVSIYAVLIPLNASTAKSAMSFATTGHDSEAGAAS